MKQLYFLLILTLSFGVYSQGYMTWNFQANTNTDENTGETTVTTAFGAQASESSYISSTDASATQGYLGYMGASFTGNNDGSATAPKGLPKANGQTSTFSQRYPNTVKKATGNSTPASDGATSPAIQSGKLHISVAFKEWLMTNDSGNTFELKIRSFDNGNNPSTIGNSPKTIMSLKLEQASVTSNGVSSTVPGVIRVVGQTWNNTTNGQFRNAGNLATGTANAVYNTPINIGVTIDYDTNTWAFWTGSPGDTSGFASPKGGISGTIPGTFGTTAAPIAAFDHLIVNVRRPAGGTATAEGTVGTEDYWIVDQIKIDTGTYTNTLSTEDLAMEDSFAIYPNPADNFVVLQNAKVGDKLDLFDVVGKKVKSFNVESESQQMDISELKTGVYFARSNQQEAIKIIKR
jgi:hypothetical protein